MVARPATAPVSSPTNFGFLCMLHSITIHVMAANDAATSVLRNASPVTAFTSSALPALKPYQPNQSDPVPMAMSGTLLGVTLYLYDALHKTRKQARQILRWHAPQFLLQNRALPIWQEARLPKSCERKDNRRAAATVQEILNTI